MQSWHEAEDKINQTTEKLERLIGTVERASRAFGNTQTVIHKSEGPGPLLAASIAVCGCTLLMMVLLVVWLVPEIHDMKAWQDILRKDVARLQAEERH